MKAVLHLPVAEQYPSSTAMVSVFASKRISGMSGGLALRPAQVCPIDIRPQLFAPDSAFGLALKVNAKGFTKLLANRNALADVSDRCIATNRESVLRLLVKGV